MQQSYLDFLPDSSLPYVEALLRTSPIPISLTPARRSKQGDFRPGPRPCITINASLNPYAFLLTLIHELAHYRVFLKGDAAGKPHGPTWKRSFRDLMAPLLNEAIFPAAIRIPLTRHMRDPRATSHSDVALARALCRYDVCFREAHCVQDQAVGCHFRYGARRFRLEKKRRVRYLCTELSSGRLYTFHPLTQIEACYG